MDNVIDELKPNNDNRTTLLDNNPTYEINKNKGLEEANEIIRLRKTLELKFIFKNISKLRTKYIKYRLIVGIIKTLVVIAAFVAAVVITISMVIGSVMFLMWLD